MELTRRDYTGILNGAKTQYAVEISKVISDKYKVKIIREPQKTLTMIKMREPVGNSLFYLGEVLCCECMVEVEGEKGFAVCMGDDFDKALDCAIIDAGFSAKLVEMREIKDRILMIRQSQRMQRRQMNAEILKSKVDFHTMGEE